MPQESLNQIFTFLCWHCRGGCATVQGSFISNLILQSDAFTWSHNEQAALLSLSRTSRHLRATAEPFLFHCIYVTRDHELCRVVRALAERPHLRSGVSEVAILHPRVAAPLRIILRQRPPVRVRLLITDEIDESLGRGDWEPLRAALASETRRAYCLEEDYTALVLLLLRLTPNLARAHFCLPHELCPGNFEVLQRWAALWTLKSVKRLSIAFNPAMESALESAAYIVRLAPKLEALHCHECYGAGDFFSETMGRVAPDFSKRCSISPSSASATCLGGKRTWPAFWMRLDRSSESSACGPGTRYFLRLTKFSTCGCRGRKL
jgi:hypothetical protein